jgi:hypothetical protein
MQATAHNQMLPKMDSSEARKSQSQSLYKGRDERSACYFLSMTISGRRFIVLYWLSNRNFEVIS